MLNVRHKKGLHTCRIIICKQNWRPLFIYEDTPDQSKATADVKKDMETPSPMDRLVCAMLDLVKQKLPSGLPLKPVVMVNRPQYWSPQLSLLSSTINF